MKNNGVNAPEKSLELLNAEKWRLWCWAMILNVSLWVIRFTSLWAVARHFIVPHTDTLILVIACTAAFAIALPLAIKMEKVHKQIQEVMKNEPEK